MMYLSLKGRKDIHVRFMRRSYRIRGRVPRITMNMIIMKILCIIIRVNDIICLCIFCINKDLDKIETNMIFIYSDMKINANEALAYSVLNPETNSLSPSVKSKGVRFVSASKQVNQIYIMMGDRTIILNILLFIIHWIFILLIKNKAEINHNASVTS